MDYKNARKAMVDSQIHPMGVSSDAILKAFSDIPREVFVPSSLKDVCYVKSAQQSWDTLSLSNIAAISGALSNGAPEYAPYDIIIFNGAINNLPANIRDQVKEGGRILAILREDDLGLAKATLFEQTDSENLSKRVLFEAGTPYLQGFAPIKEFVF